MPKLFNFKGKEVELYSIGELSSAISRNTITIRRWEHDGLLPKAKYRDNSGRRLYTEEQVMGLQKIIAECSTVQRLLKKPGVNQYGKNLMREKAKKLWEGGVENGKETDKGKI